MDIFWIILIFIGLLSTNPTSGQSEVEVQLVIKKYVEKGSSVTIYCEHNVKHEILYKVLWLKTDHGKLFEYVRVRNPPFRNFSIPGGEIDWTKSDEGKLTLKNLDFNASGHYYCEVSTDTPIFTKPSQDEHLHVILPQTGPPIIKFRKKPPFYIGDKLIALCNTTKARPTPHITWLINGKKVEDKYIRLGQPSGSKNSHRSKSYLVQQHIIQLQQQQQLQHPQKHLVQLQGGPHLGPPLIDRQHLQQQQLIQHHENNEKTLKGANSYGYSWQDELSSPHLHHHDGINGGHHQPQQQHGSNNNPYNAYGQPIHSTSNEYNSRAYENKYYENRKHRNSFNRKYRRYVHETNGGHKRSNNGNTSTAIINDNNGYHNMIGMNNEGSGSGTNSYGNVHSGANIGVGGGINGLAASISNYGGSSSSAGAMANLQRYHGQHHNGSVAISQLYIDVAEHHINSNGRLEITCLATIPAHVAAGEQFADYKTHSVKIDVERKPLNETVADVPAAPNPDGMTQAGVTGGANLLSISPIILFILIIFHSKIE